MSTRSNPEARNLPLVAQSEPTGAEEEAEGTGGANDGGTGAENNIDPAIASTPAVDPIQLLRVRANYKRSFTCIAKQIKKAIVDFTPIEQVDKLQEQINELYDDALAAHLEYCGAIQKYDDAWTAALDSARGEIHQLMVVYRQTDQGSGKMDSSNDGQRRRSTRLHDANADFTQLPIPDVSRAPQSAASGSTSSRVSHFRSLRESSEPSVRSLSSRASHGSAHSALSTLTRQRMEAELELHMIQKRRREDIEEEARLAELQRKLAEGKRRLESRKLERKVEEEVARLRMSENFARRLAEQPDSGIALEEPDVSHVDRSARGDIRKFESVARPVIKTNHDDWIRKLKGARSEIPLPELTSARLLPWGLNGAGFTCTKPFDGDPRDWPLFISRFRALVHNMVPDDAQRIAILADWLGTKVKRRVETLLTAPEGYVETLDFLQQQYGLPDKVSRCRIKDLIDLPACKTGDLSALQSFSDLLHGTVVVLQQAGNEHDLKSAANLEQIVQKLPKTVKSRWARLSLRLDRLLDLTDLDRLMQTIVEEERLMRPSDEAHPKPAVRDALRSRDVPSKKPWEVIADKKRGPPALPPTILATQVESDAGEECLGCGEPHSVFDCAKFKRKSANERAELAKAAGICFRCLGGKHRSKECETDVSCGVRGCRARHHTLLHGADRVYPVRSERLNQGPNPNEQQQPATEREVNSVASETSAEVILAIVPVRLKAGDRFLDTHALLDSGSQATLIHQDAARSLKLNGLRKHVRFSTFQGGDPAVESQVVNFVLGSRDGACAFPVNGAYVVPHLNVGKHQLSHPVPAFDHLRGLVIPVGSVRDVQVLIGMDVQDAHLPIEVRRPPPGVCGPNALLTPFGWRVVGRCPTVVGQRAGQVAEVNHLLIDQIPEQNLSKRPPKRWTADVTPNGPPETRDEWIATAARHEHEPVDAHVTLSDQCRSQLKTELIVPLSNDERRLPPTSKPRIPRRGFSSLMIAEKTEHQSSACVAPANVLDAGAKTESDSCRPRSALKLGMARCAFVLIALLSSFLDIFTFINEAKTRFRDTNRWQRLKVKYVGTHQFIRNTKIIRPKALTQLRMPWVNVDVYSDRTKYGGLTRERNWNHNHLPHPFMTSLTEKPMRAYMKPERLHFAFRSLAPRISFRQLIVCLVSACIRSNALNPQFALAYVPNYFSS